MKISQKINLIGEIQSPFNFYVSLLIVCLSIYKPSSSEATDTKKIIRVLTLDGGGTRGIIPAMILADLEKRSGKPIAEMFDLIVGTSTGGLTAMMLTTPDSRDGSKYRAKEAVRFFKDKSDDMYSNTFWHRLTTGWGYMGPKYAEDKKDDVVSDTFGKCNFSDTASRCKVIVAAQDLERDKTVLFKNYEAVQDESVDYKLTDLAMATTATPSQFKPEKIESLDGDESSLIDASIVMNNPTITAFAEAKSLFPDAEKMIFVSLGTGTQIRETSHDDYENKGLIGWGTSIVPIMTRGSSDIVDEQAKTLCQATGDEYYRIQTRLTQNDVNIDDADEGHMHTLQLRAEKTIEENEVLLADLSVKLTSSSSSSDLFDDNF